MSPTKPKFRTLEEYLDALPPNTRKIVDKIRQIIKELIPETEEGMGYGVGAVRLNGKPLLYYAAFKDHIGIYPIPAGDKIFNDEIKPYIKGKGTLSFKLSEPIPYSLIQKIARQHYINYRNKNQKP